jgi:hypothetical protein
MNMLNRSKDFGKIAPPFQADDFDRPAYYEQGGKFFDAHDREIEPGKPLAVEEPEPDVDEDDSSPIPATELLAQLDTMPWNQFAAEAKKILGPECPRGKQAITVALEQAIEAYEKRKTSRSSGSQPAPGSDSNTGVDLAAWARGQTDYIFSEVAKELRSKYNVRLTERRDAVDFLVAEGVITAKEARRDV